MSPAEPPPLKRLGKVSSSPEQYGADFLINSPLGLVGIQRKELSDLVSSLSDDRVAREIIQLKECDWAIWIIEGRPQWSSDGQALWTRTRYLRTQHLGLLFSLTSQGFSVLSTDTITDTGELLLHLDQWCQKETHTSLNQRAGARGVFGKPDKQEWQIHFLQGLPGMGYHRAKAAVEFYGGLPLALTGDLSEVPGIGKGTAKRIGEIFG